MTRAPLMWDPRTRRALFTFSAIVRSRLALTQVRHLTFEIGQIPACVAAGCEAGGADQSFPLPARQRGPVDGQRFGGFAGGE